MFKGSLRLQVLPALFSLPMLLSSAFLPKNSNSCKAETPRPVQQAICVPEKVDTLCFHLITQNSNELNWMSMFRDVRKCLYNVNTIPIFSLISHHPWLLCHRGCSYCFRGTVLLSLPLKWKKRTAASGSQPLQKWKISTDSSNGSWDISLFSRVDLADFFQPLAFILPWF